MAGTFNVNIPETTIGPGSINRIGKIAEKFSPEKIMIVTDKGIVNADLIKPICVSLESAGLKFNLFDDCRVEAPISVLYLLCKKIKESGCDLLIGVGGGSTMDTSKAAGLLAANENIKLSDIFKGRGVERALPKILVPTTAGSGSEWSHLANLKDDSGDGRIMLLLNRRNLPDHVILDPELMINLPPAITAYTGMDALAHAIEAYTGKRATIVSDIHAESAIKLVAQNLHSAYIGGTQAIDARYCMTIAASVAMLASVVTGAGLAHFMNLPLGKRSHISHGAAVTLMLPHVMEFNCESNISRYARVAELLGGDIKGLSVSGAAVKASETIRKMARDFQMPQTPGEAGVKEKEIPEMVEELFYMAAAIKAINPRSVTKEDAINLYRAAL